MQSVILSFNLCTTGGEERGKTTFCHQELTQTHYILKDQAVLLDLRQCQRCCNIPSIPYHFPGDLERSGFQGHCSVGHTTATWM